MKYFDASKKQLICIEKAATIDFWDTYWECDEGIFKNIIKTKDTVVSKFTKKYLSQSDGVILEGGCGLGEAVASLANNGYRAVGIDFAEKTVNKINKYMPGLNITLGDVRKLPFEDGCFSGYWSLGVIEHFWDGYNEIAKEMQRVIKKKGYLFLSFPYMSRLRRVKAKLKLYDLWDEAMKHDDFHEFNMNPKIVTEEIEKLGFKLIRSVPLNALKGAKDEIPVLAPLFRFLLSKNSRALMVIRRVMDILLSPVAAHSLLLIFRKTDDDTRT